MRLENWIIVKFGDNEVAVGDLYGDTRKRFSDGTPVKTSFILSKTDKQIVTTKNTYTLGKPAEGTRHYGGEIE